MMPLTIYTDADNTLWNTDSIYRNAQLTLLDHAEQLATLRAPTTERLGFVRDYDQAIASRHHQQLRYPPGLLAHALVLGLRGISPAEAAARVIRDGALHGTEVAVDRYLQSLTALPPLLPGVQEGVSIAVNLGAKLYLVTEGPQEKAQRLLGAHHLESHFSQILSATKTESLYKRLKSLSSSPTVAMVGDQLDRDVIPARNAGLLGVWIPSTFRPSWSDIHSGSAADFVADDFQAAVTWLISAANANLKRWPAATN